MFIISISRVTTRADWERREEAPGEVEERTEWGSSGTVTGVEREGSVGARAVV